MDGDDSTIEIGSDRVTVCTGNLRTVFCNDLKSTAKQVALLQSAVLVARAESDALARDIGRIRVQRDALATQLDSSNKTFADWWKRIGCCINPDISDVSWVDKREELCRYAWWAAEAGRNALATRVADLEAVVADWPTLLDGVRLVNGQTVYQRDSRGNVWRAQVNISITASNRPWLMMGDVDDTINPTECYSTREAAVAAKGD